MRKPIFFAILAAALYALNSPFSKLLLQNVPPTMMAGFLYLGAGVGMALMGLVRQHTQKEIRETRLQPSILLSVEDASSFHFSIGSLFVLLACVCWGMENNCTRKLSKSDPLEIVVVKGLGSGVGSVALGLIVGEAFPVLRDIALILLLGFVAYGLSIYFYVYAQRNLGAAKTSAYYAVAPFIGVLLSLIIFRELPGTLFFIALAIMILGTWLINHGQTESGGSQNEV